MHTDLQKEYDALRPEFCLGNALISGFGILDKLTGKKIERIIIIYEIIPTYYAE